MNGNTNFKSSNSTEQSNDSNRISSSNSRRRSDGERSRRSGNSFEFKRNDRGSGRSGFGRKHSFGGGRAFKDDNIDRRDDSDIKENDRTRCYDDDYDRNINVHFLHLIILVTMIFIAFMLLVMMTVVILISNLVIIPHKATIVIA